jgi:hypothetical protein
MRKPLTYLAALLSLAGAGAFAAFALCTQPAAAEGVLPVPPLPTLPTPATVSVPSVTVPPLPLPPPATTTTAATTPDAPPAATTSVATTPADPTTAPVSTTAAPVSPPSASTSSQTATSPSSARCTSSRGLPDRRCTTGAVTRASRNAVCRGTYVRTNVRPSVRDAVFASYGLRSTAAGYVVDHLVPLSLGGSNAAANLWPQAGGKLGYREKNRVEIYLRNRVCSGRMTLQQARRSLTTDWTAVLRALR